MRTILRFLYTHDGSKNVSEVVSFDSDEGAVLHYEYAPFGRVLIDSMVSGLNTRICQNPWRFSSEYCEDVASTVSYMFRHFEPHCGRWMSRDPVDIFDRVDLNEFIFLKNSIFDVDIQGLQRKQAWEEYWKEFSRMLRRKGYDDQQVKWAERQLSRGCVGVVASLIGSKESLTDCYKSRKLALARKQEMVKNKACSQGCPRIFSIHFWNDKGIDRNRPDVSFNSNGKADLQNWDKAPRIGKDDYVNFDFGFYYEKKGIVVHADQYHNPDRDGDGLGDYYPDLRIRSAKIIYSNLSEWSRSYADFNQEVWCVQCVKRGTEYGR